MAYYYLGMALLGLSSGILITFSQTPVVGALLPLLFGLVGGGAGAFFLQKDNGTGDKIGMLGLSLIAFFMPFLSGLFWALSYRQANSTAAIEEAVDPKTSSGRELYATISLRKKLQILGASSAEQRIILAKVSEARRNIAASALQDKAKAPEPIDPEHISKLADGLKRLAAELKDFESGDLTAEQIKSIRGLRQALIVAAYGLGASAGMTSSVESVRPEVERVVTTIANFDFSNFADIERLLEITQPVRQKSAELLNKLRIDELIVTTEPTFEANNEDRVATMPDADFLKALLTPGLSSTKPLGVYLASETVNVPFR